MVKYIARHGQRACARTPLSNTQGGRQAQTSPWDWGKPILKPRILLLTSRPFVSQANARCPLLLRRRLAQPLPLQCPFFHIRKPHWPSAHDVSHRRRLRRLHAFLPHAPCSGACVARNPAVVFTTFSNHMASCSAAGLVPPFPTTMR